MLSLPRPTERWILLLAPLLLLTGCTGLTQESPSTPSTAAVAPYRGTLPQIINVSAYDPKERTREGKSYTVNDVSALRANGAHGLIARAGKGGKLDTKCASFLTAADRAGMLPGLYYRMQKHVSPVVQADQLVDRAQALATSRSWNAPALLLCGDYDGDTSLAMILSFMDRVESRTGVVPVAYLENSTHLKQILSNADAKTKARLRRAPYWLALYAHDSGAGPVYPAPGNPAGLVAQYDVWPDWTLWQYGGVQWENGGSRAKVYNHGAWQFPKYFGNLDRPVERNVFNGSPAHLQAFWRKYGLPLK